MKQAFSQKEWVKKRAVSVICQSLHTALTVHEKLNMIKTKRKWTEKHTHRTCEMVCELSETRSSLKELGGS